MSAKIGKNSLSDYVSSGPGPDSSLMNSSIPHGKPDYMELYPWEVEHFDYYFWQNWFASNWIISVYLTVIYVTVIFGLQAWMKNKEPYRLRGILVLWNFGLAIFSTVGFLRVSPEILHLLQQPNGFHESVCSIDKMHIGTVFWCLLMSLSKVAELWDTVFVVLRKHPLIFLHWYHHVTVMLFTWYTYVDHDAGHRWFTAVNFFVHSIMYSYYGLKALGLKIPRNFAMAITSTQLLQMFFGIYINAYALYASGTDLGCQTKTFNITLALLMYLSYAVLFANFFIKSYTKQAKKKNL